MILDVNFDYVLNNADKKARKMVDNGLYSRFNLSLNSRIEKAKLGCMGEIAFEKYLIDKGIHYQLDQSDFSKTNSDQYDFLIKEKKIDIKVAKKSTKNRPNDNWTYGYPQEQNPISKDVVIVGWVDFIRKEIGFYGWISGKRISKYKVVSKNSFVGYKYFTPNHEFPWGTMNKNIEELLIRMK
jgi:hypothetical protein